MKSFGRAETVLKQAVSMSDTVARAHVALGMLYYRTRRHDDAVESFAQAIALSPEDAELRAALGAAQSKAGRPDEAAAAYAKAIELGRRTPQMHFQLGAALSRAGDTAGAQVHVEVLEKVDPTLADRLRAMIAR